METQEAIQLREERASELLADARYHISFIGNTLYRVEHPHEETGELCSYVVDVFGRRCSCPDGVTRKELHLGLCKHVCAVLELLARFDAQFDSVLKPDQFDSIPFIDPFAEDPFDDPDPETPTHLPLTILPYLNSKDSDPAETWSATTFITRLSEEEVTLRLPAGIKRKFWPKRKGISREQWEAGYRVRVEVQTIGKEEDFVFEALEVVL